MSEEPQTDFKPKSLDDIVSRDADAAPEAELAPEQEQEPVKEAAEAPKGEPDTDKEPAKAEEPKDAPPVSDDKPVEPSVPLKALQEERRKRQELESRLTKVEREGQRKARPDPFEDPRGAAEFDRAEIADQAFSMRVELSQEMMRELHADYDDVEAVFMEAASSNPALSAQLANHPFPAKYAYAEGQRIRQLQAMGDDPAAYIERVKKEAAEAATKAALEAFKNSQAEAQKALVPDSLAEAPSASRSDVKQWSGPKPLSEILK